MIVQLPREKNVELRNFFRRIRHSTKKSQT